MIFSFRRNIARVLIIAFLFFLIPSDSFSLKGDERTGLKLIKKAEKLFKNYKYLESIDKFREAEKYVKLEKSLSRLYLGISRSYYAMGLMEQVKGAINKLAELTVKGSFKKSEYPRGYLKIYNDIQSEIEKKRQEERIAKAEEEKKRQDELIVKTEEDAESLYQVEKTGEETTELTKKDETSIVKKEDKTPEAKVEVKKEKSLAGVIEKPGRKKKKKKSLLLPITLGAVVLGAVALLLGKKSGDDPGSNTASVHIESVPSGASVYVDGTSKGVTTPCDIKVSEGSREIRVQIERWGETSTTQSFTKNNNYSLNAKLTGYIYKTNFSYEINPLVPGGKWDLDHGGNLYAVYILDGNYRLVKYDPEGIELFDRILQYNKNDVYKYFEVFFNNISNVLYLHNIGKELIHTYDTEGEFSGGPYSIPYSSYLSENNSGGFYLSQLDRIQEYNAGFQFVRDVLVASNNNVSTYRGIKVSDDSQSIYITEHLEKNLKKYDISGNIVQKWSISSSSTAYLVTSLGTGDLERVFFGNSGKLFVYNGDGELLSRQSESDSGVFTKIAEDGFGNIYSGYKSTIHKFEPSDTLSGEGIWEVSSIASTSSRMGSLSGFNSSIQQKRTNKPNIKKDTDKKRAKNL